MVLLCHTLLYGRHYSPLVDHQGRLSAITSEVRPYTVARRNNALSAVYFLRSLYTRNYGMGTLTVATPKFHNFVLRR